MPAVAGPKRPGSRALVGLAEAAAARGAACGTAAGASTSTALDSPAAWRPRRPRARPGPCRSWPTRAVRVFVVIKRKHACVRQCLYRRRLYEVSKRVTHTAPITRPNAVSYVDHKRARSKRPRGRVRLGLGDRLPLTGTATRHRATVLGVAMSALGWRAWRCVRDRSASGGPCECDGASRRPCLATSTPLAPPGGAGPLAAPWSCRGGSARR